MLLIILHAINFFRIFEIVLSKYFIFFLVTSVQYHDMKLLLDHEKIILRKILANNYDITN